MSNAGELVFALCAFVALLSALGVVIVRSPIRAAMSLLVHIVALAALFLTLHAHLLAALQVLVYAGAVVVLFVFVIMLIGPEVGEATPTPGLLVKSFAIALTLVWTAGLAAGLAGTTPERPTVVTCAEGAEDCAAFGGVDALSHDLYVEGVVPFELLSILLTVAIVGAIAVARMRNRDEVEAAKQRREQHLAETGEAS
jgi:NADH-quinone oxidoreductase subunit J